MGKGSKQRPISNRKQFDENWDKIFNQKMKQKSMTELNWDGNEERGRYGEDESSQDEISPCPFREGYSVSI